jgi:O-antigen ligase
MYGINEELGLSAAIKFGMVTVIFSLLALVIALDDRTPIKARCLHACAFLVGFAGCHAIGSRGPWLVMVLVGFGIFIINAPRQYGKTRWLTLFLGLLSVVLVALVFHTKIHHFISSISAELMAIDNGNFNTSSGHRIEMWKAALAMFIANPFFGVGMNQFGNHLQQMIASAQAPQFLVHYGQTHNEYFQALATGGIVGFAYLLWLFVAPLFFFIRHLAHRRKIGNDSLAPLGGLVTILAFALFSITDNIFDRQMTTSLFAFLVLGFVVMTIDKKTVTNVVLRE